MVLGAPVLVQKITPTSFARLPLLIGVVALFAAGAMLALADEAEASHYRYGTLNWAPTDNPNEVCFGGAQVWRASWFGSPAVGTIISTPDVITTGDGGSVQPYMVVTSYNAVGDWLFADLVASDGSPCISYTYATPNNGGPAWTAKWTACCRIGYGTSGFAHINNANLDQTLETRVDLSSGNSSPQTNLPPINPCPFPGVCTFAVPAIDADGDLLSYRLSTRQETGSSFKQPGAPRAPNAASIDAATGVVTWDTTGASSDASYRPVYSMQVMVQDGATKTPVDFFIELVPAGTEIPYWLPESACGTTIRSGVGVPIQFDVAAMSDDAGRTVALNHLGIPSSASFPIPSQGNTVASTFTWTPSIADAGPKLLTFTATDDLGYLAANCAVILDVFLHEPPEFVGAPCGVDQTVAGVEALSLSFGVSAQSINATRTVSLTQLSGPAGLTFAPGTPSNPATGVATWAAPAYGQHSAIFRAQDSGGERSHCTVSFDITRPDASSLTIGLWVASTAPAETQHETVGARASSGSFERQTNQTIDLPDQGVRVEGFVEEAGSAQTSPTSQASGLARVATVTLADGQVELAALTNEASLVWSAADNTYVFDERPQIGSLRIAGVDVPVDPTGGTQVIDLPTGGRLILFERTIVADDEHVTVRSNLIHYYRSSDAGAQEIIIGSLNLQAGNLLEPLAPERYLSGQGAAQCTCETPTGNGASLPLAAGPSPEPQSRAYRIAATTGPRDATTPRDFLPAMDLL